MRDNEFMGSIKVGSLLYELLSTPKKDFWCMGFFVSSATAIFSSLNFGCTSVEKIIPHWMCGWPPQSTELENGRHLLHCVTRVCCSVVMAVSNWWRPKFILQRETWQMRSSRAQVSSVCLGTRGATHQEEEPFLKPAYVCFSFGE